MSAKHSALAKTEEARRCCEGLEVAEERLEVAKIAANKARNDAKTAKEEASKFDADYIAEMGTRQEEVGGSAKHLRQQVTSAASGSKELAAVHADLDS